MQVRNVLMHHSAGRNRASPANTPHQAISAQCLETTRSNGLDMFVLSAHHRCCPAHIRYLRQEFSIWKDSTTISTVEEAHKENMGLHFLAESTFSGIYLLLSPRTMESLRVASLPTAATSNQAKTQTCNELTQGGCLSSEEQLHD